MSRRMTWLAQRYPVGDVVPEFRRFCPRLQMMSMKASAATMAILASPVVAPENSAAKGDIRRVVEISVSQRRGATLPIRVCRPMKMVIDWRAYSSGLDAATDCGFMAVAQHAPAKSGGYVCSLRRRTDAPSRCRLAGTGCADLGASLGTLRRVVAKVRPCRSTGVRAEPLAASGDEVGALFAASRHKTEFTTWN